MTILISIFLTLSIFSNSHSISKTTEYDSTKTFTLTFESDDLILLKPMEELLFNPGVIVKIGNHQNNISALTTLISWNTKSDGTGDNYFIGDEFLMPKRNLSLYPIWVTASQFQRPKDTDNMFFGSAIAVNGNIAIIGASSTSIFYQGKAFVYEKQKNDEWKLLQTLTPIKFDKDIEDDNMSKTLHGFGNSVTINDDFIVIGAATYEYDNGAVYIFRRNSDNTWVNSQKLLRIETNGMDLDHEPLFGASLALSNSRLVIGTPGESNKQGSKNGQVTIYKFEKNKWEFESHIFSPKQQQFAGFGESVAINENSVIVGAPHIKSHGKYLGAAFIYQKNDSNEWNLTDEFYPDEKEFDIKFGHSVDIGDNKSLIGSYGDYRPLRNDYKYFMGIADEAYIVNDGELTLLEPHFPESIYGSNVKIDNKYIIIAAEGSDVVSEFAGEVYVYNNIKKPELIGRILPFNKTGSNFFGSDVSISGSNLIISNQERDNNENYSGSVFYYNLEKL